MAYIEITGIDNVMAQLAAEENGFRSRAARALEMAAGELRKQLRHEEQTTFKEPSGELGGTLGWDGVQFGASSAMIDVYAKGSYLGRRARKTRRAGLVAGLVEYKHKNPWNERARTASTERINSIFAEVLGVGGGLDHGK